MTEDAPRRGHDLREVFNGMRWVVRTGSWWHLPHDLPPWQAVCNRWPAAGASTRWRTTCVGSCVPVAGHHAEPTAAVSDGRTPWSTPESGGRAGYDGANRVKGFKAHMAIDTLGYLLSLHVTAADEQDRARAGELFRNVQKHTGRGGEGVAPPVKRTAARRSSLPFVAGTRTSRAASSVVVSVPL